MIGRRIVVVTKLKELPHWNWFEAVYFWEHGETAMLAGLVIDSNIPEKFKPLIRSIVAGKHQPSKKKAAAKIIQKQTNSKKDNVRLVILQNRLEIMTKLYDDLNYLEDLEVNQLDDLMNIHRASIFHILDRLKQDKQDAYGSARTALDLSQRPVKAAYDDFKASVKRWT